MKAKFRVGLISDTHGLLRPEAVAFLRGCSQIVHGGDIGDAEVLQRLAEIAPVAAVRGNNDSGAWADAVPESLSLQVGGIHLFAVHDLKTLKHIRLASGVRVVVSGHSHKPLIEERDGILYVNPGSAGPRRFRLPISIGELVIEGDAVAACIEELK